ncbi:hypothetical protein [Ectothiorhodospira variabilis]|nr:hypothetical protein [Ectothiorhodospira variabilis]
MKEMLPPGQANTGTGQSTANPEITPVAATTEPSDQEFSEET